jgi:hypothetical protein
LFLGRGELAFQAAAVDAQFGAALVDVAEEVLVEVAAGWPGPPRHAHVMPMSNYVIAIRSTLGISVIALA